MLQRGEICFFVVYKLGYIVCIDIDFFFFFDQSENVRYFVLVFGNYIKDLDQFNFVILISDIYK